VTRGSLAQSSGRCVAPPKGGLPQLLASSQMRQSALGPAPLTRRSWRPWPPWRLQQQTFCTETEFSIAANDQMVMQGDPKRSERLIDSLGHVDVTGRGRRIA